MQTAQHTMNSKDTYISYITWVPIWFPHCPTWQWTISLMLLFFQHFWAQITASVFNMHDCSRRFQADKIRVSCITAFWIGGTLQNWVNVNGLIKVNLEFSFSIPGLFQTWNSKKPGFEKLNSRSEPGFEMLKIRSKTWIWNAEYQV